MAIERRSFKGSLVAASKRGFGVLHRSAYRWSGGRLAGRVMRAPVLLLTVRGRRSGKNRTVPLVYFEQEGAFVVASSNAGHWAPAWLGNVLANPDVSLQIGRRRLKAHARIAPPDESADLWTRMESLNPAFVAYPESRGTAIPMVVLDPADRT